MIRVENVHKSFKEVRAVRGVSFEAPDGKITGLLGPNGAGKSTTLKAISGLLKTEDGEVTGGEIRFLGQEIRNADPERIGLLMGGVTA